MLYLQGAALDLENLVRDTIDLHHASGNISTVRDFHRFTSGHKNSASFSDFKYGLLRLNIELPDSKARLLFDKYDEDHSGTLDFEEFKRNVMGTETMGDMVGKGEWEGGGRTKGQVRTKVVRAAAVRDKLLEKAFEELSDMDAIDLEKVVQRHIYQHFTSGNTALLREWHTFTSDHKNEGKFA